MNKSALLASLAVAATATAAEIKDPAEVARDWNRCIEQASQSAAAPKNLLEQVTAPPPGPAERTFGSATPLPQLAPGRRYDAPGYRIPRVLPDNLPPGSKLWEFNGQKFWVIPISPDAGR